MESTTTAFNMYSESTDMEAEYLDYDFGLDVHFLTNWDASMITGSQSNLAGSDSNPIVVDDDIIASPGPVGDDNIIASAEPVGHQALAGTQTSPIVIDDDEEPTLNGNGKRRRASSSAAVTPRQKAVRKSTGESQASASATPATMPSGGPTTPIVVDLTTIPAAGKSSPPAVRPGNEWIPKPAGISNLVDFNILPVIKGSRVGYLKPSTRQWVNADKWVWLADLAGILEGRFQDKRHTNAFKPKDWMAFHPEVFDYEIDYDPAHPLMDDWVYRGTAKGPDEQWDYELGREERRMAAERVWESLDFAERVARGTAIVEGQ